MEKELLMTLILTGITMVSPASGLLTDPGPLCPGEMATLTCNLTGGLAQQWIYNTENVGVLISPLTNQVPEVPAVPMEVDGVEFRVSLLSTSPTPYLASQIAFVASERMGAGMVTCETGVQGSEPVMETISLQVGSGSPPSDVRQSLPIQYGIEQSTVTIEWTPPPNGGNDVMYTIGTTPAPLSGAMSVSSAQTTITVIYNISYTVTVGVDTTCNGVQEATGTIYIAGCPRPPVPMDGSIIPFPATNEGAEIVYHCDPGFQPQSDVTGMCASNGLWTPDPALLRCTVIPSNVTVSCTTEGATVTFQCEEGLIPSHPIIITCTRNGRGGQWIPDPAVSEMTTAGDTDSTSSIAATTSTTSASGSAGSGSALVTAVSSVLLFLVGLVGGFAAGTLVAYCRTHHRKPHPPLPAPLYEEVEITTTHRQTQQELKLEDNVAYGHVK